MKIDEQRIASLALFKSIYEKENCNIYTIVDRFIIATVRRNNLESFEVEELRAKMNEYFNVDIENAVLTAVLNYDKLFEYVSRSKYETKSELKDIDASAFDEEIAYNNRRCQALLDDLYAYFKRKSGEKELDDKMKILIKQYFLKYVIDKEKDNESNEYVLTINEFVVSRENDNEFVKLMSSIREGLTIYEGINFSDTTDKRTWQKNTIFYLDVHYLFSAYGFNSDYHKKSFLDFYNLVETINDGCPRGYNARPRIMLKYFSDTREAINRFFNQAVRMKRGNDTKEPLNEAMEKILEQCDTPSDVVELKARFFTAISNLRIEVEDDIDIDEGKDYLFETQDVVSKAEDYFPADKIEEVKDLFKIADYINILRKGAKVNNLENCGYIFLTDKNFAIEVSKFLKCSDPDFRPHVFHKMDWFTERMWYLSNRSLTGSRPVNFDLINKAKNVISGLCKTKVHDMYMKIKAQNNSTDLLIHMYHEFRQAPMTTDSINSGNVKASIEFCQSDSLKMFEENYALMKQRAMESEKFKREAEESRKAREVTDKKNEDLKNRLRYAENEGFWKRAIPIIVGIAIIMTLIFSTILLLMR